MGGKKAERKEKAKATASAPSMPQTRPLPQQMGVQKDWRDHVVELVGLRMGIYIIWYLLQMYDLFKWFGSFFPSYKDLPDAPPPPPPDPTEDNLTTEREAWQSHKEGRHDVALKRLEELLEEHEKVHGKNNVYAAALHTKMSKIQLSRGKLFEAWVQANIAHNTYEFLKDSDEHFMAMGAAKHDIGIVYVAQKKTSKALKYFDEAVAVFEKGETEENEVPVSAAIMRVKNDIAALQANEKEFAQAEETLSNALKGRGLKLGDDAEVANAKIGVAGCIIARGQQVERGEELLELYEWSTRVYAQIYGKKHKATKLAQQKGDEIRKMLGISSPVEPHKGDAGDAEDAEDGREDGGAVGDKKED